MKVARLTRVIVQRPLTVPAILPARLHLLAKYPRSFERAMDESSTKVVPCFMQRVSYELPRTRRRPEDVGCFWTRATHFCFREGSTSNFVQRNEIFRNGEGTTGRFRGLRECLVSHTTTSVVFSNTFRSLSIDPWN